MHHNPRAFDTTDPDAGQALRDALPIVAAIQAEARKPQPKNVDLLRAWRDHMEDLRQQLVPIASRLGWTANELEQIAKAELSCPTAPATAAPAPTEVAPVPSRIAARTALKQERAGLLGEIRALTEEERETKKRKTAAIARLSEVEQKLFPTTRGRA